MMDPVEYALYAFLLVSNTRNHRNPVCTVPIVLGFDGSMHVYGVATETHLDKLSNKVSEKVRSKKIYLCTRSSARRRVLCSTGHFYLTSMGPVSLFGFLLQALIVAAHSSFSYTRTRFLPTKGCNCNVHAHFPAPHY